MGDFQVLPVKNVVCTSLTPPVGVGGLVIKNSFPFSIRKKRGMYFVI